MKEFSRRKFIGMCFRSALIGLGAVYFPFFRKGRLPHAWADTPAGFEPAYLGLHKSGELKRRGMELWQIMESCKLCPRGCGVNRLAGMKGFCDASSQLEISSYHPHFGEEKPLVGRKGSGTVFFTNCGLRCVFCINWDISQGGQGYPRSIDELVSMMLELQSMGCHNINLVTPTHYLPHIILAVDAAALQGLRLPLVYNTCGGEKPEMLKFLNDVVDIYLPDFKYSSADMASKYSRGASSYPEFTKKALSEMHRQVGVARPASDSCRSIGPATRHAVTPQSHAG